MTTIKNTLADFYLEYLNDWLTVSAFAEWHELTEAQASELLTMGRLFHEERAANAKGVTA